MELIDTHTHLFDKAFDKDRKDAIKAAIDEGVTKFYLPNIDEHTLTHVEDLHNDFPKHCFPMYGLHPCSVKANYEDQLKSIEKWLGSHETWGIGETGIDLYWDKSLKKEQIHAFQWHIHKAIEFQKPLIIHCRESMDLVIEVVKKKNHPDLKGIFHCFTGDVNQAKQIIDMGFKLGIGGVLTFKNSGLDKTIKEISPEHLVLETDSPYLAPTPHRGKRNESGYLPIIAQKLADIKEMPLEEVARITTKNAKSLFD